MALIRFRVPKHKQFEYQPRYWDAEKEALQERIRKKQEARDAGLEGMRERVKMGFRRSSFLQDQSYRKRAAFRSNMTLLAVVVALLGLTYLFLNKYLPVFIRLVEARQDL
ncbi:MAG: hypothetical protein ACOYOO_00650 [Saprospiraceae bacterium]|jgi:hypothetical protein